MHGEAAERATKSVGIPSFLDDLCRGLGFSLITFDCTSIPQNAPTVSADAFILFFIKTVGTIRSANVCLHTI